MKINIPQLMSAKNLLWKILRGILTAYIWFSWEIIFIMTSSELQTENSNNMKIYLTCENMIVNIVEFDSYHTVT